VEPDRALPGGTCAVRNGRPAEVVVHAVHGGRRFGTVIKKSGILIIKPTVYKYVQHAS
jgi:hypothetical protein